MFEVVIDFVVDIMPTIQQTALSLLDWFTETIDIAGLSYTYYEMILGGGLTVVFTYAAVKFVVSIIP